MTDKEAAVMARVPRVLERLRKSVSGYVRSARFGALDRAALGVLIARGEAEIFESAVGRAYRLIQVQKKEEGSQ
jgi:long-subunit acyl-CoA synthetase (AMP-forming)